MEKTKNVFRSWKIMGKSFVILLATLFWIKFQWKFILCSKWGTWVIWRPKINSFEIFLKLMDEIFLKLYMIETTPIKKCFFFLFKENSYYAQNWVNWTPPAHNQCYFSKIIPVGKPLKKCKNDS